MGEIIGSKTDGVQLGGLEGLMRWRAFCQDVESTWLHDDLITMMIHPTCISVLFLGRETHLVTTVAQPVPAQLRTALFIGQVHSQSRPPPTVVPVVPEDTKENKPGKVVVDPPKGEGVTGGVVVETGGIAPCIEESKSLMVSTMIKRDIN
jgi:hypothetical protein